MLAPLFQKRFRAVAWCAMALAWLPAPSASVAQTPDRDASKQVAIKLDSFGVGNRARKGDFAGVRLVLTLLSDAPKDVVVRLSGHDPDGDRPLIDRIVTLNPGQQQGVWLYERLPFDLQSTDAFTVSVYEAPEDVRSPGRGLRVGRLMARSVLAPSSTQVIEATQGMIAIVGAGSEMFGLGGYAAKTGGDPWAPLGNERTEIVVGVRSSTGASDAGDLPDRWMGLMPYEAIVWAPGTGPRDLARGDVEGEAIREWVQRGGHLIVLLPAIAQQWTSPSAGELFESLLPRVTITTNEEEDLDDYRAIITSREGVPLPARATVHTLTPADDAEPGEAMEILRGPRGNPVVVRRLVGTGAVTLVGIDLKRLAHLALPEPEAFWHRVLGRRGPIPSNTGQPPRSLRVRTPVYFDEGIPGLIAKGRNSAAGVLLGFVVFIIYWAIAGPAGYALLASRGWKQHSWLAYVLAGALFTAIAWGGATLIKPGRLEASHVTFLQHVFGNETDRARAWMTILIPRYGQATISVGDPDQGERTAFHNTIAPWDVPAASGMTTMTFPDTRDYSIDARGPSALTVPTRSTVKQVRVDWAGPTSLRMPYPVDDETYDGSIRLRRRTRMAAAGGSILVGALKHDLGATLQDVVVIVNRRQVPIQPPPQSLGRLMPMISTAYKIPRWAPGELLRLDQITAGPGATGSQTLTDSYLERLVPKPSAIGTVRTEGASPDRLTALTIFGQLPPPKVDQSARPRAVAQRRMTHTLDARWWFSQPSVIVVGHLGLDDPVPSVVPVFVDGQRVPTSGRIVLCWIYPLAPNPPAYARARSAPDAGAGGGGPGG